MNILCTGKMLDTMILWNTLFDIGDDKLILDAVEKSSEESSSDTVQTETTIVINLRKYILAHLIERFERGIAIDGIWKAMARYRWSHIDNCLQIACSIARAVGRLTQTKQVSSGRFAAKCIGQ